MNFCCCVSLILYSFTFLPFFPFAFFFSPRIYGFNLLPPLNLLLRCPLNVDWWLWMSCKQKWQEKKKVLRSIQKGKNRRFHIGLHGVERILCHLSFHNINSISIELKSGYFCFKLINIYLYIYLHILFTFTYIVYIYIYRLHLNIYICIYTYYFLLSLLPPQRASHVAVAALFACEGIILSQEVKEGGGGWKIKPSSPLLCQERKNMTKTVQILSGIA